MKLICLVIGALTLLAGSSSIFAQTTYVWGPNGSGTPAGGTGTWDTTSLDWLPLSTTTYQTWPGGTGGNGAIAYFGGTGGAVTVSGTEYAAGITFAADGYTLASGTLNMTNFTGYVPRITVLNQSQTATISAALHGSTGIEFNGLGTLVLNGKNTFTGNIGITAATLQLMTVTGTLAAGNSLTMGSGDETGDPQGGGGTFILDNTGATKATVQKLSGLYADGGDSVIQTNDIAAQNLTLNLVSESRFIGATVDYIANGGINGSSNKITLSSQAAGFINAGTFFGGSNFAWYNSGTGYVRGINYGSDSGALSTTATSSIASTSYVQTTGAVTAQTTATFTTLNMSGGNDFTIAAGNTLTLSGLLKSGGGSANLNGGTLQIGSTRELVARADQAADGLTIGANITDATAGASAVTVSGSGTVYLAGNNSYSAGTYIDGTVSASTLPSGGSASSLGTGPVYLSHGNLIYTGPGLTTTGTFTVMAGAGEINVAQAGANLNLSSGVDGPNDGVSTDSLVKGGLGTLTLSGTDDDSGLILEVAAGTAVLAKTSATFVHGMESLIVDNGGTAQLAGSGGDQIYDGGQGVTVNTGGVFDLNGQYEAFDALSGGGTVTNTSPISTGSITLGVSGDAYGTPTFSGVIADGPAQTLSVTKEGNGTQILSGVNTYTGPTVISGGILAVTGSGSIASSSVLNIQTGGEFSSGTSPYLTGPRQEVIVNGVFAGSPAVSGTLTGSGSVPGTVTVNPGGVLLPGSSPGILYAGGLTLDSGGTIRMEIGGTTAGTKYDEMVVSGAISLSGSLQISLLDLGNGFTFQIGQKFFVLDDTDNVAGNGVTGTFSNAPNNLIVYGTNTFRVNYADNADGAAGAAHPNDVSLTVVAAPVPEPGTGAALASGAAILAGMQWLRRRRRKAW